MTTQIGNIYRNIVLRHPYLTLTFLFSLFLFVTYHAKNFELDASADSLLIENDRDLMKYREVSARYATQDFLLITFEPKKDLFSKDSLKALKNLKLDLEKVDGVDSVVTILDLPLINSSGKELSELAHGVPTIESEGVDLQLAKKELTESPIFKEYIISIDGQSTGILINLKNDTRLQGLRDERTNLLDLQRQGKLSKEDQEKLDQVQADYQKWKTTLNEKRHTNIKTIRSIMESYKEQVQMHLGGVPMISDDMISYIQNDLNIFGFGVFLFLIITLSFIFRSVRCVLLPLLSCAFAGLFMIGLLGLMHWKVTVISSNFISLMLILTMAMNVHLVVRYLQLSHDYPEMSHVDIVLTTTSKMVWPCLYTALTTIIAFGSLIFSDIKPVVDFGWMMSIGLAVTFLTSFLLFPALLVSLKKFSTDFTEDQPSYITRWLAVFTRRQGKFILCISGFLVILSVVGISQLQVENSFINYFKKDTEIYQGMKLIDDKFGGTTPLEIILDFKEEEEPEEDIQVAPTSQENSDAEEDEDYLLEDEDYLLDEEPENPADYWFQPHKIDSIKKVHAYLEGLPAVGKVLSFDSSLRVAEKIKGREFDSVELAILYKKLPKDIREDVIDPYISIENNEARITLRIKDSMDDLRRNELLKKIRADLIGKLEIPEDKLTITGILVLYNNMLQSLFSSQILSIGFVMLGISLMFLILFRSIKLSIIGIIPNIIAAGLILGLLGLLRIPLDMMTITIASITIGIAVDNCIHYIYRFKEEFAIHGNYAKTLHICHTNIGKAIYYTSLTIIFGFSILVLSNFIPTIYFGLFTAMAMATALLAALTLLPKLIIMWKPFGEETPKLLEGTISPL